MADIKEKIKKIRMLVFDVDGVMTNGRMFYTEKGDEFKVFNAHDGMGTELIRIAGYIQKRPYILAAISGEDRKLIERRLTKLRFNEIHLGTSFKIEALDSIMKKHGIKSYEEVAYFGDDINDIPILEKAGFKVITSNAPERTKDHMKARNIVDYETKLGGGSGAVREAIDVMLENLGLWEQAVRIRNSHKDNLEFRKWEAKNCRTCVKRYKE